MLSCSSRQRLTQIVLGLFAPAENASGRESSPESRLFRALKDVWNDNDPSSMSGLCGTASSFLLDALLPEIFQKHAFPAECIKVSAPLEHGPIHYYNLVRTAVDGEPPSLFIVDLSAAQFFSRPKTAFSGMPFFIGPRNELKSILLQAQSNTLDVLRDAFPEMSDASLEDFDLQTEVDFGLKFQHLAVLKESDRNCVLTETVSLAWGKIWGDHSRYLEGFDPDRNMRYQDWTSELLRPQKTNPLHFTPPPATP